MTPKTCRQIELYGPDGEFERECGEPATHVVAPIGEPVRKHDQEQ